MIDDAGLPISGNERGLTSLPSCRSSQCDFCHTAWRIHGKTLAVLIRYARDEKRLISRDQLNELRILEYAAAGARIQQ